MTTDRFNAVEHTRFTDVKWVTQIGSTNTELLSLARKGGHEGNVLIADMQTAGRGRRGREEPQRCGAGGRGGREEFFDLFQG